MAKKRTRKFPYYYVLSVDGYRMKILDINSIQEEKDGKLVYVEDTDKHIIKEINVPGSTKKEQDMHIRWINDMTSNSNDTVIVYDHRRKSLHEEYKIKNFIHYESVLNGTIEEDDDIEEIEAITVE